MDNGSASVGSSHLNDNSFRTAASSVSSQPDVGNPPAAYAPLAFPPPPVPWSEPPVPSPLPHPPFLGSNISFPSPASGVRFNTDPSSSPAATPSISHSILPAPPLTSHSVLPLLLPHPDSSSSPSSSGPSASSSSGSSSSSSSPEKGGPPAAALPDPEPGVVQSSGHTPTRSFSNVGSPPYSAFQSASDTPFFSPSTPSTSTPFLTPPSESRASSAIHTPRGDGVSTSRPDALLANPSRDSPPGHLASSTVPQAPLIAARLSISHGSPGPAFSRQSPGPSFLGQPASPSAGRPRSCDVFISLYGKCPSLHRFGKWMRAELELQGVACFSADRSLYSDTRSHDIAWRIMNSATFGVVPISRDAFRNQWTMEELQVFLKRKNLIPVFFDISPSDCSAKDIVERRGRIWERHGGQLWTLYDGEEKDWWEIVEGLLRVDDWRLEAYDGNWRSCIQRAVGILGSRLGRRSIAEREKVRIERIDVDEFPFPRNMAFAGREKELKTLEEMLFYTKDFIESEAREALRRSDGELGSGDSGADTPRGMSIVVQEGDTKVSRGVKGKEADLCVGIQPRPEIVSSKDGVRARERSGGGEAHRGRQLRRERTMQRKRDAHNAREYWDPTAPHSHGCACISGQSGIGKSELALEYAYRNAQKYKLILWVNAENRYIRQNYLQLSRFLGVDVGGSEMQTQGSSDRGRVRSFDEQETEAYQRIRRELSREVPYLLIVDNLESERDWWDGKEISDLLPTTGGGASHVIITTCLSRVMQFETMELSFLSESEALHLMRGTRSLSISEQDDLKEIEDKLARLTLGLAIVGRLLSDLPVLPSELLESMIKVEAITDVRNREDEVLRNNPWLFRLLNVCVSLLENAEGPAQLAEKMVWVGGWFAPSSVPFSLLALSASKYREKSQRSSLKCWGGRGCVFCCCAGSQSRRMEAEAGYLLVRYGIARRSTREGCLCFHEIVQVFARRRGGNVAAKAAVQGVRKGGLLHLHLDHYWAASFLVLRFGNDTPVVELRVPELLSFTRKVVLPLALRTFSSFTRCQAAIELLHLSYNMLEDIDKSFVSQIQEWWDKSMCWRKASGRGPHQVDEYVWHDLTLLKALLLETRAKLLVRGGLFDAGEEICRTCISIRTVMLGPDHPQTIAAQETLTKLVRSRNNAFH